MKVKFILGLFLLVVAVSAQVSSEDSIEESEEDWPLPKEVILEMSTRRMRYHHYLWHQLRDNWYRFADNVKEEFRKIGWEPPRPARHIDANGDVSNILDNDSGEDFLYMHRQMIAKVNSMVEKSNDPYGKVKGWTTIPAPNDTKYPVPPAYDMVGSSASTNSSTANRKTDSYYSRNIVRYEQMFKDPDQLKNMTLGELGARIDETIHGWIHMRWSGESFLGYRNSFRGTIPDIDEIFDTTAYDWLADSYASQVHPLFWKIHGWIDDRIEDWRKAHNLTTITWKGTWTGGPMSNLSSVVEKSTGRNLQMDMDMEMDMNDDDISVLEQVFRIFQQSGVPESSVGEVTKYDPPVDDNEQNEIEEENIDDRISALFGTQHNLNNILYIFLILYLGLNVIF